MNDYRQLHIQSSSLQGCYMRIIGRDGARLLLQLYVVSTRAEASSQAAVASKPHPHLCAIFGETRHTAPRLRKRIHLHRVVSFQQRKHPPPARFAFLRHQDELAFLSRALSYSGHDRTFMKNRVSYRLRRRNTGQAAHTSVTGCAIRYQNPGQPHPLHWQLGRGAWGVGRWAWAHLETEAGGGEGGSPVCGATFGLAASLLAACFALCALYMSTASMSVMPGGVCTIPALVLWAVALATAAVATRQDSAAFTRSPPFGAISLPSIRRGQQRASHRSSSTSATPTSMSLLRTFEANELQLQRFIGELGFVEITDW